MGAIMHGHVLVIDVDGIVVFLQLTHAIELVTP